MLAAKQLRNIGSKGWTGCQTGMLTPSTTRYPHGSSGGGGGQLMAHGQVG